MSWIGLTDHKRGGFIPFERAGDLNSAGAPRLFERGTLMFETHIADEMQSNDLLGISHTVPYARALKFRAIPYGGVAMHHCHKKETNNAEVQSTGDGRAHTLRVTYAWDTQSNWARFTVEQPARPQVSITDVRDPLPLITKDLQDLMLGNGQQILSKEVLFAALSSEIAPIGPMPTLHSDTPIATPMGYRAAGDLQRGDTVLTSSGDIVPVLHVARNRVPARGSFAPVCLRAPYFGLKRDIVVAPEQRLVMQGSEVEYNFGQDAVLVSARHVVNGQAAQWITPSTVTEYVQLVLPGHEVLLAAGCPLESLYIGRLRRNAERLAASVLAHVPSRLLPEHAKPCYQVLRPFEAITLLDQRAA